MPNLLDLNLLQLVIILVAGVIAGFVNTLAGGGSLLTIPALLFAGLASPVANATNRVAVVMQSLVGAARFRQKKVFVLTEALPMLVPAFVGSIVGASVAAELDQRIFDIVLGVVLLSMVVTLFFDPAKMAYRFAATDDGGRPSPAHRLVSVVAFFGIGFYGGFVQVGVGFLLIIGISTLFGFDLIKTNGVKLMVVGLYSLFALTVFAMHGQVLWLHGVVLGIGTVLGALLGVRFAMHRGTAAIKVVVVLAVALSALRLFGVLN
ncbi:MAG: sulfite exporter TauE/SafE family protein [Alkalispirochaeta sp.]